MCWELFFGHFRAVQRVFRIACRALYGGRHNNFREEFWAIGRTVFCETKKFRPTAGADLRDENSQSDAPSPAIFSSLGFGF